MTLVVDASVAVKWFVKERGREQALGALDASERHAPDLVVAEVGNVAWKMAIRREVTGEQARFICASVRRYFAALHRGETLVVCAIEIALQLRRPVYDCLYLACARRAGTRLVTADEKLLVVLEGTTLASLAVHIDAFIDPLRADRTGKAE